MSLNDLSRVDLKNRFPHVFALSLLAPIFALTGCEPDVGECDPELAQRVVFANSPGQATNGLPAFAGQAMTQSSCSDGAFCHSPNANGALRFGVPAGLDFDVAVPCDLTVTEDCAERDITRLGENRDITYEWRSAILREVQTGQMPPGESGAGILADAVQWQDRDGADLPAIDSDEGQDILANWLACGAPVVEVTVEPDPTSDPGRRCEDRDGDIGLCVYRAPAIVEPPDPNWTDIWEEVIEPQCGLSCHGPGDPDFRVESALDLSTKDAAYAAMVGAEGAGEECSGTGTLIVAGDSANSILIDKLGEDPECGGPMPSAFRLMPQEFVDAIAEWIDAGALDD